MVMPSCPVLLRGGADVMWPSDADCCSPCVRTDCRSDSMRTDTESRAGLKFKGTKSEIFFYHKIMLYGTNIVIS